MRKGLLELGYIFESRANQVASKYSSYNGLSFGCRFIDNMRSMNGCAVVSRAKSTSPHLFRLCHWFVAKRDSGADFFFFSFFLPQKPFGSTADSTPIAQYFFVFNSFSVIRWLKRLWTLGKRLAIELIALTPDAMIRCAFPSQKLLSIRNVLK